MGAFLVVEAVHLPCQAVPCLACRADTPEGHPAAAARTSCDPKEIKLHRFCAAKLGYRPTQLDVVTAVILVHSALTKNEGFMNCRFFGRWNSKPYIHPRGRTKAPLHVPSNKGRAGTQDCSQRERKVLLRQKNTEQVTWMKTLATLFGCSSKPKSFFHPVGSESEILLLASRGSHK